MQANEPSQNFDHAGRTNAAGHVDRETLMGELINDGQAGDSTCWPLDHASKTKS